MRALLALALAAGCAHHPRRDETLRAELLRMKAVDQEARQAALRLDLKDRAANERMVEVDKLHTARLKEIVSASGWPAVSAVGADGAEAAWLLAQHADLDPAFQEECLALMEPLVSRGEASKSNFAYLTDRVLRARGKPQRFGTQFDQRPDGSFEPQPVEDPANLDARRAAMGLPPMAEQTALMRRKYAR